MVKCATHVQYDLNLFRIDKAAGLIIFMCQDCLSDKDNFLIYQVSKETQKLQEIRKIMTTLAKMTEGCIYDFYPLSKQNIDRSTANLDAMLNIMKGKADLQAQRTLYFMLKEKMRGPKYKPVEKDYVPSPSPRKTKKDNNTQLQYLAGIQAKEQLIGKLNNRIIELENKLARKEVMRPVSSSSEVRKQPIYYRLVERKQESRQRSNQQRNFHTERQALEFDGVKIEDKKKVQIRIERGFQLKNYRQLFSKLASFKQIKELRVLFKDHKFTEAKGRSIVSSLQGVSSLKVILLQNSYNRLKDGTPLQKLKLFHPTAEVFVLGAKWFN